MNEFHIKKSIQFLQIIVLKADQCVFMVFISVLEDVFYIIG